MRRSSSARPMYWIAWVPMTRTTLLALRVPTASELRRVLEELLRLLQGSFRLHSSPHAGVPGGSVLGKSLKAFGELVDLCSLCVEGVGRPSRPGRLIYGRSFFLPLLFYYLL